MIDYLSLGPAPIGIDPIQVGVEGYETKAKKECQKYIKLLKKKFSNIPENCSFVIKNNSHDFGCYYDVNIKFDNEDKEQEKFAFYVERNLPDYWEE